MASTKAADTIAGFDAPAGDASTIVASDATVLDCRSVYVGGAGNVAVTTAAGTVVTFVAVPAGSILPVRCSKVMSTNTTATSMLALY